MTQQPTETESPLPPMFDSKDRCDQCGAQARMRVVLSTGLLLFCGHHGRQHTPGLAAAGAFIESEE